MRTTLFAALETAPPPPPAPALTPVAAGELLRQISESDETAGPAIPLPRETTEADAADIESADVDAVIAAALREMLADPDCAFHPEGFLYQDFSVRCRMQRLARVPLDLAAFRRRFALAKGGIFDPGESRWHELLGAAARLPDDMLAPFVLIARAAAEGLPCPDDDELGRAYGTRSPGRVRRLVEYMERQGAVVVRSDFGGRRSIGIPELGLSTEAE
jgi:hypothetical protein